MEAYQEVIKKLEANRERMLSHPKADANTAAAIDLALLQLRRADRDATPALIREYRGIGQFAVSRLRSNEEFASPGRKLAQEMILRMLPN